MLYILTPIFCAGLCLGTVFSFLKTDRNIAEAATAATVSEITINGSGTATNGFVFRQDNLNTLYNKILNKTSGGTLDEIASTINGTSTYKGTGSVAVNKIRNSTEINGGALLKVRFGGLEWQVTSVTKNNGGDVIASLWLTDNNSSVDTYVNSLDKKGQFSYGAATTSNVTYPSSIYGTSFIRVAALNAGGQYSTSTTKATTYSQNGSNVFAKFTMTGAAGSLTKYIAKPSTVKYQEIQSFAGANTGTAAILVCPNEAYGTPCINTWSTTDVQVNINLSADYSKWKDDYIWLPSYSELGGQFTTSTDIFGEGLWKTTVEGIKRTGNGAWLRSANNTGIYAPYGKIMYAASAGNVCTEDSNSAKSVRPALHLNLTEAQKVAVATLTKPYQAQDLRYNGEAQTYTPTGFDSNTMTISGNVVTALGEYTCTVKPKSGYAWSDYSTDGFNIPFKVKKTPSNFTFGYVNSDIDLKKLYLKDYPTLPEITNVHDDPTPGELTWNEGQSPSLETSVYYWTFKPTNSDFYEEVSGFETLNFREAAITGLVVTQDEGKDIYDRYDSISYSSLENYLKSFLDVYILYEDDTISKSPLGLSDYKITTKDIFVTEGDSQGKTIEVEATTPTNAQLDGMTGSISTEIKKAVIESISVSEKANAEPLVYPLTMQKVKDAYEVKLKWNFSARAIKVPDDRVTVELTDGGTELSAGTLSFTFTYTEVGLTKTADPVDVEISKGTHNVSGITFVGDELTFNNAAHSIAYSGTLPSGVGVQYTYDGTTQATPFEFTNAGEYEITLSFTQTDTDNYEVITKTVKATLKINKAKVTGIVFANDTKPEITGTTYTLAATGVPEWVTVSYSVEGQEGTTFGAAGTYLFTATFSHGNGNYEQIEPMTATLTINDKPPVAGAENIVVAAEINVDYNGSAVDYSAKNVPDGVGVSYSIVKDGDPSFDGTEIKTVGVYTVTVSFETAPDKADIAPKTCVVTVSPGTYNMNGVALSGDLNPVFNNAAHSLTLTGNLPAGVNYTITYTQNGEEVEPINAGEYTVTVTFTGDYDNYIEIGNITATLNVGKATVTGIVFKDDVKPEITGETYTLEATGLPAWVTVEYYYNDEIFTGASAAGEYDITAKFTIDDEHAANYLPIGEITKTLTISDKPPVEGADDIVVETAIDVDYDGSAVDYTAKNVPEGVGVSYEILKDGQPFEGEEIISVGVYTVTVKFDTGNDKAPIADKICVVTISPGTYDMDGVELTGNRTVVYNGEAHGLTLSGTLPDGVEYSIKYYLDGEETTPNAVGTYDVVVSFTNPDPENYKDIGNITATLTISDAMITGISAAVEVGAAFTTVNTLDELKAKLSVTAVYENGTKEAVTEFTVTATVREGGLLEVGTQTVTVTYNDGTNEFTTTVEIEVFRAKVALPVYKNTLSYTGGELKPAAADFEFNAELVDFVDDKTAAGTNAGVYKAVFALKDTDRYEWATATTLKKALFAVALYDLEAGEAEVEWKIAKAKITATVSAGNPIPEFKSENFRTMPAGVVGLKYYTDKECTQEIAADALDYDTKYYVKAELLDGDNFEFDSEAESYTLSPVEYTTPEKELTIWEKIIKFVTVNWLWIAIAAATLLVLIIIIACAAHASKKKRRREELAEQRRLEKEERDREERRLEREERMARMSQQQMIMPQMMPQGMPQAGGQAMAMGGASSNEILELKAEMAAMRTEVTLRAEMAAKESAEIKAVHAAEQQVANLLARLGGDQVVTNGVTLDKLTELVEKTVERVLDRREKSAAAPSTANDGAAAPAAAQVPPDTVMTTVTTTKIDTTKKSAQNAQAAQAQATPSGRTAVRNFVAPMPVDDGRVFDVGGFYNPADPVTDDIDNLLGDDNK